MTKDSMENPYQAPQSELREPNNPIEGDQVLASRWARLFAAIIDSIIGGETLQVLNEFVGALRSFHKLDSTVA